MAFRHVEQIEPLLGTRLTFSRVKVRLNAASLVTIVSTILFCNWCHASDPLDTWDLVFPNTPAQITSMAYGNGTFIGVGGGLRFVSNNGSNWTASVTPPSIDNGGIAFGNGMFLAFGTNIQNRANYVLQSTNGTAWTPIYSSSNTLVAAAYGNNTWVFIGTNRIVTATMTSSNWNWSEFQPGFAPACISYANGSFLISAIFNFGYSIFSSSDGATWQYHSNLPTGQNILNLSALTGIAFGNGVYVTTTASALGYNYSTVFASSNLSTWTPVISNGTSASRFPVIYGGNQFMVSSSGTFTSANGYAWTNRSTGSGAFSALAYGQGSFVGCSSSIYKSGVFGSQSNQPPAVLAISTYPGVTINGVAGWTYQIQQTTNLNSSWLALTNLTLPHSPYIWVDTRPPIVGQRFYRSVQLE